MRFRTLQCALASVYRPEIGVLYTDARVRCKVRKRKKILFFAGIICYTTSKCVMNQNGCILERLVAEMILKDIWLDIKAVQERDPAARSALEVLLLYQGIHALIWHRFAHWFYQHKMFFIARLISQIARFFTLIEIHPGATLGRGILIDHGSGVVIGETAVVGDNCTIYQGVTLGGVGTKKGKRHPTLGNNVMVGAGAKILGAFEVGDNCSIAANAVLLKPLEDNVTAVGIPARPIKKDGVTLPKKRETMTLEEYEQMKNQIRMMAQEITQLKETVKLLSEKSVSGNEKTEGESTQG